MIENLKKKKKINKTFCIMQKYVYVLSNLETRPRKTLSCQNLAHFLPEYNFQAVK